MLVWREALRGAFPARGSATLCDREGDLSDGLILAVAHEVRLTDGSARRRIDGDDSIRRDEGYSWTYSPENRFIAIAGHFRGHRSTYRATKLRDLAELTMPEAA